MAVATIAKPGSLFGVPGVTHPTEQRENNDGLVATPNATTSKPLVGLQPFRQTDVIVGWRMEVAGAITFTVGTGSQSITSGFPFNFFGAVQLKFQNQFSTIDVQYGQDLEIFQLYRPYWRSGTARNLLDSAYATYAYSSQANAVSASNYTAASTTQNFVVDLPAAILMDRYWNLDINGQVVGAPVKGWVSPQYMAGSARIIAPVISLNPLVGNQDNAPVYNYGSQTTAGSGSGNLTLGFQRLGYYQPAGAPDSPILYNWQYVRKSNTYSIAGVSKITLPLPINGQIFSVWVRLYNPSATVNAVAVGAPIAITTGNVTKCQLQYGSGLYRFDDTVVSMQERFGRQHDILLPEGHLVWDLVQQPNGDLENGDNVLNTMTTSGCQVVLQFGAAQSATAYAVVGVEGLQYVEPS